VKVFNTLTRRVEPFVPLEPGHARLYTCGPTVYNFAHIGNFRTYVFEDLLRRTLKAAGYRVTQVMNLTDVDDKTIRGANEAGVPLRRYTQPFVQAFFDDLRTLNIEPAERYPAATDHVPEMVALIARLIERGHAYRSDDGSVYFKVSSFPAYGKLAHLDVAGLQAGARVAHDEYDKEHVADFALWKAWDAADGDVAWDSPWGRGRPGWHIECSAMSMKYLGESFDIHTGGVDNIFPHHENEIAQSEAATGQPFVRFWMHSEHLRVESRKMSKSLGNFHTLRDLIQRGYTGRELRFVLLSAHYRQTLNFTFAAVDAARASLARLDEFQARLAEQAGAVAADARSAFAPPWAQAFADRFRAALEDDLNMPEALAALFDLAHEGNRRLDRRETGAAEAAALSRQLADFDRVLGVLAKPEERPPNAVLELAARRDEARKARNWAESDRVRASLAALGWDVRDTPEGAKLKRK
jgi:cysteinyl-tRNA synthetase